jgi:flavodoxin I
MRIGIFYGSTNGNTERAAELIKTQLSSLGEVDLHSVAGIDPKRMGDYDVVILGTSTWGAGQLQEDWDGRESFSGIDLSGKCVAIFGLGDQMGFGDTFVDAIGILADSAEKAGAILIGKWPTEGYEFASSFAVRDARFVGLALDEDNQPTLTAERIQTWTEQLKAELNS